MPKWMDEAEKYDGLKEKPGSRHEKQIVEFFDDVGHDWVKDDETPWCAAFVGACFERVGMTSTRALNARSYLKWGKKVTKPKYGDVVVFWRGKKSGWQGHVAFYVRETDKYVYVYGGNQRNAVNTKAYSKSRVLGYRRPVSVANSRTAQGGAIAVAATVTAPVVGILKETQSTMQGIPLDWAPYAVAACALAGLGYMLYARWDDNRNKGR